MVTSKHFRVGRGDRRKRKRRLENDGPTKRLSLVMEMDEERKPRQEKMVATAQVMLAPTKGVVYVGVFLSVKPILKSWQLCLSFKFDVLQLKEI